MNICVFVCVHACACMSEFISDNLLFCCVVRVHLEKISVYLIENVLLWLRQTVAARNMKGKPITYNPFASKSAQFCALFQYFQASCTS